MRAIAWTRTAGDVSRLGTVRVRTTLVAVGVVAVALAAGALTLVASMRHTLTDGVRRTTRVRAEEVATQLDAGTAPGALVIAPDEDLLVQVLDRDGRVLASSPLLADRPAIARLAAGRSAEIDVPTDDDPFLAVAVAAEVDGEPAVVIAARSLDSVSEPIHVVRRLLALGFPLLVLVVAVTAWKGVGRALRPVDAMRREVDEISAAALHRRVPRPTGSDEIARLAVTLNQMLDRLEDAQTRQRQFVSDASHELRSPVAAIRQHAEVALAHPDRVTLGELAETVLNEDIRVQQLVDDLLLLARLDEHTLETRRRPVDLDDLVFDEARRLRETTTVRVDTSAVAAGRIAADEMSMRRVLRNLADNASRHARERVAFSLTADDEVVVLRVDDDGPGIAAEDRVRVFERFVRLDGARARDAGGGGLGLAIVAELVAVQGGSVSIGDSPIGGARFELRLPAHPGEELTR